MRHRITVAAGLISIALLTCTARIDQQSLRSALIDAERAFAADTAERGTEGWVSWFAEDGTQFFSSGLAQGHDAIRARMAPFFRTPGNGLTWEPADATVAASGDLGYTIGRWERRGRTPEGESVVTGRGSYVTIWRLQPDGTWKVAVDIGNQDAPPPAPSGGTAE